MNKKTLILGGSSFIGRYLFDGIGQEKALATYNKHPIAGGVYFNALTMSISDIIDDSREFSYAVILLGDTNPDSCVRNTEKSEYLNVTRICKIIDQLKTLAIIPLFLSTEVVFDGEKGGYSEADQVNPILTYGIQKAKVEQYLQIHCEKFIIARLAKVFSSHHDDGTFFTAWLDQLENNVPILCARDQIFSPIHINDVVMGLKFLMKKECSGVFHFAGRNSYKRIDMLKILIKHYRKYMQNEIIINECSIRDVPVLEKRPFNISMKADKLIEETGLQIRDIDTYCQELVSDRFERASKNS